MIEQTANADNQLLRRSAFAALASVALLWLVFIVETVTQSQFTALGIYPRSLSGLPGVLFAPLIHGSFEHLVSNTLPVFILGTAFLYAYPRSARIALPMIYLVSGILVWLFARPNVHIGASGISYGLLFFLLVVGVIRRDRAAIGVSMVVFFLYGSLIWGVFPGQPGVSFESHLAGALCGTLLAVLLRNYDAVKARRRFDWEDEEDDVTSPGFVEQLQQLGVAPDVHDPDKSPGTDREH